jgi:hypothetical protein
MRDVGQVDALVAKTETQSPARSHSNVGKAIERQREIRLTNLAGFEVGPLAEAAGLRGGRENSPLARLAAARRHAVAL